MTNVVLDWQDLYLLPKLLRVDGYSLYIEHWQGSKNLKVGKIGFDSTSILILTTYCYATEAGRIHKSDEVYLTDVGLGIKTKVVVRDAEGSFKFCLKLLADYNEPDLMDLFKD